MFGIRETLNRVSETLEKESIPCVLIGTIALSEHNHSRATQNVEFLIPANLAEETKAALLPLGFTVFFESADVLQFNSVGNVDFLLAHRPMSLQMLKNATLGAKTNVPCVTVEDLIGLKIQAYFNNPKRALQDQADIQALIEKNDLDWPKVKTYADLFQEWPTIEAMKLKLGK